MRNDLCLFQEVHVVVAVLVIPVQGVDKALHRIENSVTLWSVSPDRRSPSYDFNQDDSTHHGSARHSSRPPEPSNPPAWHHSSHQPDWPSNYDDYQGRSVSNQDQHVARLGHLGKWGDGGITNRIHPDLVHVFQQHHNLGPNLSFSSSHYGPSGKRKKPAKSLWQHPQSDQAHHSSSGTPIQKGHIKVSLKDDTQRDWINKVRFALNSKQRMRAACELTDAQKPQPCITVHDTKFQTV
jgi:hypothetical protein